MSQRVVLSSEKRHPGAQRHETAKVLLNPNVRPGVLAAWKAVLLLLLAAFAQHISLPIIIIRTIVIIVITITVIIIIIAIIIQ